MITFCDAPRDLLLRTKVEPTFRIVDPPIEPRMSVTRAPKRIVAINLKLEVKKKARRCQPFRLFKIVNWIALRLNN